MWCLAITGEEVLKHYSVAKTVKTKSMHDIFFYEGRRGVTREKERFDYN